jgi:hypothetical protein
MAPKLRHRLIFEDNDVVLIGDTDEIQYFFPGVEPEEEDDDSLRTVVFSGGTRRRFPGGPTHSFSGGTRKVIFGKPAKQQTLPGNPVTCEETIGEGPLAVRKVRQFTLQGSFTQLLQIARYRATRDYILRSPNGKAKKVPAAPTTP